MANADIDPPEAFIATHPGFASLLLNEPLSALYTRYDAEAVRGKRIYTFLGVYSLATIFITISALIYSLSLNRSLTQNSIFELIMALVGVSGVVAQLFLLFGPSKRRWLESRFAAERLRAIKYQAFIEAAATGPDRTAAVSAFMQRELAHLQVELGNTRAAMHDFDPDQVLGEATPVRGEPTPQELQDLKDIYRELRLDYQVGHARRRIEELQQERRLPAAAAEISFWGGAAMGYVDVILAMEPLRPYGMGWEGLRQFLTLFLFVSSAILFVLERGRGHNSSLERYEDYRFELSRVSWALGRARNAEEFIDCVRQAERVALRELKAFCRETDKSTYLL